METSERLQQEILTRLDQSDAEAGLDTRTLGLGDGEPVDQQSVLGVLKRLAAHEVRAFPDAGSW